jgi:hypothetical protein
MGGLSSEGLFDSNQLLPTVLLRPSNTFFEPAFQLLSLEKGMLAWGLIPLTDLRRTFLSARSRSAKLKSEWLDAYDLHIRAHAIFYSLQPGRMSIDLKSPALRIDTTSPLVRLICVLWLALLASLTAKISERLVFVGSTC